MPEIGRSDIAGVIVLYRPGADARDNTAALAAQVGHVFVVDNTESPDPVFVRSLADVPNVTYASLGDNLGIATALNAGIAAASDAGYAWALTMDQDSTPTKGMAGLLAGCAGSLPDDQPVGLVAPDQVEQGADPAESATGCDLAFTAMTSGDLLSIRAWSELGGFLEDLFIDQVDHEMCLRMHRFGFAVLRCHDAKLTHHLGATRKHLFPVAASVTHHSAMRRYYITRNRLRVADMYGEFPRFRAEQSSALGKDLVKIALFEDHKIDKLVMSWRGYRDYRRGVTGRYGCPSPSATDAGDGGPGVHR